MAEHTEQPSDAKTLLDLPDAILEAIVSNLVGADRLRFMAVCQKAAQLAMLAAEATLKITEKTKLARIKKVLEWVPAQIHLKMTCPLGNETKIKRTYNMREYERARGRGRGGGIDSDPEVEIVASSLSRRQPGPAHRHHYVVYVFLGNQLPHVASNCHWEAITKITIKDINEMKCLVPPVLAATCPQLTQLNLLQESYWPEQAFTCQPADMLPLTPCSSLKHLQLMLKAVTASETFELPPLYHSIAELRNNLPNINTLIMAVPSVALVEAYAAQLTRLEIGNLPLELVQPLGQCSRLGCLSVKGNIELMVTEDVNVGMGDNEANYLSFLSSANIAFLKILELTDVRCTDKEYATLLQLPHLTTVKMPCICSEDIRKDWSGHACSWQELHFQQVPEFVALARLSLSSLKKLSVGWNSCAWIVFLPDPTKPGSLAAVQRAADNLAHVGKIMLEEGCPDGFARHVDDCTGAWQFNVGYSNHDSLSDSNYDQATAELIRITAQRLTPVKKLICDNLCGSPLSLRAVLDWSHESNEVIRLDMKFGPPPHVWQALQQLRKLKTVLLWGLDDYSEYDDVTAERCRQVCNSVHNAAQDYVIPTNRSLRMEIPIGFYHSLKELESMSVLGKAIIEQLPAGSKLDSVDHCTEHVNEQLGLLDACIYWVVVVAPSPPAV